MASVVGNRVEHRMGPVARNSVFTPRLCLVLMVKPWADHLTTLNFHLGLGKCGLSCSYLQIVVVVFLYVQLASITTHCYKKVFFLVRRTIKIHCPSYFQICSSFITYSHHAVHYINDLFIILLMTYSFYNWKFVPFHPLLPISSTS